MGLFGYVLNAPLTEETLRLRRNALDLNATIANFSIGVILVLIQVVFGLSWLIKKLGRSNGDWKPSSPYQKHELELEKRSITGDAWAFWRRVKWYMGESVIEGWGTVGEWLAGVVWFVWLMFLCVRGTTPDYMHLTKRFGLVAASQLPLHYLLAIKSPYSPIQLLTRTSHEQLNMAHQILGRIIQTLLTLHAAFYLNFFYQNRWLAKRIQDRDVVIGMVSISLLTVIGTTALSPLRKWNYRIFYYIHIIIATALLPLLFFHVKHIRPFILESVAVYILHIILRFTRSNTYPGSLSIIPGTNLTQVNIPISKPTRNWQPGSHVYLTTPSILTTGGTVGTLKNPFTIASLPRKDGAVTLIARTLNGNTKTLAARAKAASMSGSKMPMQIEGPYGISSHLPNFAAFDRILLVAGGVGATFIIPIYRSILSTRLSATTPTAADVRLVWSVRKVADTTWALPFSETSGKPGMAQDLGTEQELYITGSSDRGDEEGESIEMAEREGLVGGSDSGSDEGGLSLTEQGIVVKHRRPDLREIVDEMFRGQNVGKVAVLVCGPPGMGPQLRREVGRWVKKGKDVYFHAEEFGL